MALTKVTGGILSQPIDLGITTATTGFFSGIVTAQSVRVLGDLTVDGSTTTLDTVVTEVDRLEVGANNVTVGVAITQSGTGDILNLYDGSNKEFSVADGGTVKISQSMAFQQSDRVTTAGLLGRGSLLLAGTQQTDFAIKSNPHNSNLILGVGVTERLRIDSNGRVLIGTTTEGAGGADELTIANTSSSSGITIRSSTTATGNIYFSDGTSGTNQYRGVVRYDHNDNYMSLWSNSSERLRITGTGRVGIGTTNPTRNLQIGSLEVDSYNVIRLGRRIASSNTNLPLIGHHSGDGTGSGLALCATSSSGAIHFFTGNGGNGFGANDNQERVVIKHDGKVGIGTDNPQSLLTLGASSNPVLEFKDYTNNARSQILGSAGGQLIFQTDITRVNANSDFIFRADGGDSTYEIVRFKDTGEVGIGTDNPTQKLNVIGKAWIDNSSGDSVERSDGLTVSHAPGADFAVASDPSDSLRTASFIAKGGSRAAVVTLRNVSDNSAFWDFIADGNTDKFYIQRGSNTGAALGPAVSIDTSLNVGIGTDSTGGARLRVYKDNALSGDDRSVLLQQWRGSLGSTGERSLNLYSPSTDSSSDYYRFQTGNAFKFQVDTIDALCINSSGLVGIGTATPQAKLDVTAGAVNNAAFLKTGSDKSLIEFEHNAGTAFNTRIGSMTIGSGNVGLLFETGTSSNRLQAMVIDRYGKVGIGTNAAGTELDVFGFFQVKDSTGKLSMQMDGANGNFKVFQSPPGWTNLDFNPNPILAWDFKSGPGDMMYMASGGNTPTGTQMALVISDNHGFKVGRSGYDGTDFDVSPTAEWFRIANGGFVGIGTNAPQTKLHVRQDFDNNTDGFRISRTNSAASYSQYIDTSARFNIGYSNPSTADPSPQITLDQDGKVGINQTNPSSKLTIKDETGGQSLLIEGAGGNDVVVLGSVNGATNRGELILKEGTGGAEYIKLTSRASTPNFIMFNNFGVGTTTPTQKLEVYSGHTGRPTFRHSSGFGGVQIAGPQNASGASLMFTRGYDVVGGGTTTYSIFLDGSTQGLHFISGDPSEYETKTRLLIDSSGKVGIGTASPTAKLSVGRVTGGYMNMGGIQVNRPHSLGLTNGILVYTDIGFNPTASYRAAAFKAVGTTGNALGISTDQGSNGLGGTLNARIGFDGGAYFSGNVGIGTDNPQAKLDVIGNVAIEGNVHQSSNNGLGTKTFVLNRSYTMSTSSTDVLSLGNWGNSSFDITVFRRDTASPAGSQVMKLYIAFAGSGTNMTSGTIVQETKVTRGSIHTTTYSISDDNDNATLSVTGNDNGGEGQSLTFYIIGHGSPSGFVNVI